MRKPISTTAAPAAIGPFSQAIVANNFLFISGQLPIDPATGKFASDEARGQAVQSLKNLAAIAAEAGADLKNASKIGIFLTDMADFAAVNEVYAEAFAEPFPARSTVQVAALPLGAKVEIEAIVPL
ncbi:RidA family protein [Rhodobacteraceae bacterium RKSG542]|uniref:Rid family detoxifying hydrolase n=1 Tax=Pseudovibrio flavus TaxID=2529854 RepID=UPI0012BB8296|nr:Rid family detoxifying hydrolase [Pseudovibrio flavus]MTI16467.1 RidA family protein [Pseudovibrio flavus]